VFVDFGRGRVFITSNNNWYAVRMSCHELVNSESHCINLDDIYILFGLCLLVFIYIFAYINA
jgi:lipoprotein signal peptidase